MRCRKRGEKGGEVFDAVGGAGGFEARHVAVAACDGDDEPVSAAGDERGVHDETRSASVAVRVGMDVDEEEVPENGADAAVGLASQKATVSRTLRKAR